MILSLGYALPSRAAGAARLETVSRRLGVGRPPKQAVSVKVSMAGRPIRRPWNFLFPKKENETL